MDIAAFLKGNAPSWEALPLKISSVTCTPIFIEALLTMAKAWKQPKCPPTDKWVKGMRYARVLGHSVMSDSL